MKTNTKVRIFDIFVMLILGITLIYLVMNNLMSWWMIILVLFASIGVRMLGYSLLGVYEQQIRDKIKQEENNKHVKN
ncbi:hypothetical protein BMT55_14365 [Listeria newyorkensis]|uniref:DUF2892 domain-containing protein n=1 Tax=Listeria newyorkensis TaxID=1497681 RepID=A0ABX4XL12_9LIST|nr:hypothetical protein [Listeria newyorkensis]KGL43294.1 hypothetical protein EP58_08360 [Listeria newyorkensis]KMT62344.1 hypothetical protein X559_1285 [Listeria newyorkensis]PNP88506.1 hypothetical protein BMT55_14365 [Listeria newyorkensis]WAO22380.1 hypothetical protein OTR81_03635 [Listeria newyorkensis]SQC50628.1 Uncharacterised protein [Listeria newyorkensis]